MGSLVLAAVISGLGLVAVLLWQPVASHAGASIQAGWRDLFGVPAGDGSRHADPEPPVSD